MKIDPKTKMTIKIVVTVLLAAVAIILLVQNREEEKVIILWMNFGAPRAILLLVTLAIGFAAGVFTAGILRGRKKEEPKP